VGAVSRNAVALAFLVTKGRTTYHLHAVVDSYIQQHEPGDAVALIERAIQRMDSGVRRVASVLELVILMGASAVGIVVFAMRAGVALDHQLILDWAGTAQSGARP